MYRLGKVTLSLPNRKVLEPNSEIPDVIIGELKTLGSFDSLLAKGHIVKIESVKTESKTESKIETEKAKDETSSLVQESYDSKTEKKDGFLKRKKDNLN